MKTLKRITAGGQFAVVLSLCLLTGCVENPPPTPELTFAHASPIMLKVRVAEIDSAIARPRRRRTSTRR
ncbi:MAG: hypothetical protein HWD60_08975 [Defluviicoccus sp.]|nr:MAG: hypothetical protein HWD60_08975 [Defluviicoccus sp.]